MSKSTAKKSYSSMAQSGLTPGKIALLVFLFLTFMLFLSIYLFLKFYTPTIKVESSNENIWDILGWEMEPVTDADGLPKWDATDSDNPLRKGCYGFLIVGKDYVGWNTDTMMYVMLDTQEDKISVIQLPRDTYINSSYAGHRLNGVLANGRNTATKQGRDKDAATILGIRALSETIRMTLGVPINYYVLVDVKGFTDLVEVVGGVEVYVPFHMKYDDPYQNLYIDLPKGLTLLDGDKAQQFVRFRQTNPEYKRLGYQDYPRADIDRLDAQKEFLTALMKKLAAINLANFSTIRDLVNVAVQNITTDVKAVDMLAFAKEILQIKPENIRMFTAQGEWNGNVGYYSLYKRENIDIINNYINPYENIIPDDKFNIVEWSRTYAYLADTEGVTMEK